MRARAQRDLVRIGGRLEYLAHGLDVLGRDQLTLELFDAAAVQQKTYTWHTTGTTYACQATGQRTPFAHDLVDHHLHLLQIHVERIGERHDTDSPARR